MKKAKHTPGPWYVIDSTENKKDSSGIIGTFDIKNKSDVARDQKWLADVKPYGGAGFTGYEEAKANAHLIAAAPDLLAVAIEALDFIKTHNHYVASGMIDRLQSVIEKATGEPVTT
jgi:hypothetical protein